jgi:hypothetical protein
MKSLLKFRQAIEATNGTTFTMNLTSGVSIIRNKANVVFTNFRQGEINGINIKFIKSIS